MSLCVVVPENSHCKTHPGTSCANMPDSAHSGLAVVSRSEFSENKSIRSYEARTEPEPEIASKMGRKRSLVELADSEPMVVKNWPKKRDGRPLSYREIVHRWF